MKVKVREIIDYLNQHVISQDDTKKQLAVLIKNKERYEKIEDFDWKKNITPFNALMIGPTGSGKTELFRKLAEYLDVAFCKVDISSYTRSGYVGKSVDEIINVHLFEAAKKKTLEDMRNELKEQINNKLYREFAAAYMEQHKHKLDIFQKDTTKNTIIGTYIFDDEINPQQIETTLKQIEEKIRNKDPEIMQEEITIVREHYNFPPGFIGPKNLLKEQFKEVKQYTDKIENLLKDLFEIDLLKAIESNTKVQKKIKEYMENGIVFIDEIDKIAGKNSDRIDTAGVQKELLTLIEGTIIQTEIGPVNTDHILFIAAGAFHTAKPSDLLPELLGRFPVRIVLKKLTKDDLRKILVEPKYAILKKIQKLYEIDNIKIEFTEDAIDKIAEIAYQLNNEDDDLGARRLHTIVNMLTEDIDFEIEDRLERGEISEDEEYTFVIDENYVENKFNEKNTKIKEALEYINNENKKKVGFVF